MVSPKTSETLAREVGARVETIHTIETSEDDESYLDRMRDNLEKSMPAACAKISILKMSRRKKHAT